MNREIVVKADNLGKEYNKGRNILKVLKNISFEIARGDIVSIIGPSGAGKSTLLNLIGCLDEFQNGSLNVLGKSLKNMSTGKLSEFRNSKIGFIFQQHNLLPEFTAVENIMIPLLIRRVKKKTARKAALELLERFNLTDRSYHKPSELSGGECQRIAVARAVIAKPDIILADEPTGSLDSANSSMLIKLLFDLGEENNTTILIVTHDMDIASLSKRTMSLKDGVLLN